MLITRETDYALRILRALTDGTQKNTAQICKMEMISQQFAYKIIKKLKNAGLIQITRGIEGGCTLTGDLNKVSLYDLIQVVEGSNEISACMNDDFACERHDHQNNGCHIHVKLKQIQRTLDDELKSHSLQEMLSLRTDTLPGNDR